MASSVLDKLVTNASWNKWNKHVSSIRRWFKCSVEVIINIMIECYNGTLFKDQTIKNCIYFKSNT